MLRVGYLWQRDNPGSAADLAYLEQSASDLQVSVRAISASRAEEIEAAFADLNKGGIEGLILDTSLLMTGRRSLVVRLAERGHLPTIPG